MDPAVEPIPLQRLAVMFVPVFIVVVIQIRWAISGSIIGLCHRPYAIATYANWLRATLFI